MTDELKPCPGCGASAIVLSSSNTVACDTFSCGFNCESKDLESAIKEWNKRVGPCERCERLDKYVSTKIDENYYKCGLWVAERIKKAVYEKSMQCDHYNQYHHQVDAVIDKILEEERQRQESNK